MFDLPHFIWVILVIWAVWYGLRWLKALPRAPGSPPRPGMRRDARPGAHPGAHPGAPPQIKAEDLVACKVCGTYVAADAPACGRRGCPRPQ